MAKTIPDNELVQRIDLVFPKMPEINKKLTINAEKTLKAGLCLRAIGGLLLFQPHGFGIGSARLAGLHISPAVTVYMPGSINER